MRYIVEFSTFNMQIDLATFSLLKTKMQSYTEQKYKEQQLQVA